MRACLLAGLLLFGVGAVRAQDMNPQSMDLGFAPAPVHGQQVEYVAEPQVVRAGHESELELRFTVRAGYHVNSHTPKSELLIPTRLEMTGPGVQLGVAAYPTGRSFHLGTDTLDVYADDFVVRLPVQAPAGQHELRGTLRYQACDHAACFPPRTLPVDVVFTAK